jgi:hypothetical protein
MVYLFGGLMENVEEYYLDWLNKHKHEAAEQLAKGDDKLVVKNRLKDLLGAEYPEAKRAPMYGMVDSLVGLLRDGLTADHWPILEAGTPTINLITIEGDNNTLNVNTQPRPTADLADRAEPAEPSDNDPHRFTIGDYLTLKSKLAAHEHWATVLQMENDDLQAKRRGPIDGIHVAFVACLWRKNIKQNVTDPGAVPFDVVAAFVKHNQKFIKRVPCNRQVAAALSVLESVGFLKQVRRATQGSNGRKGECAAYKLLNEDHWQ